MNKRCRGVTGVKVYKSELKFKGQKDVKSAIDVKCLKRIKSIKDINVVKRLNCKIGLKSKGLRV